MTKSTQHYWLALLRAPGIGPSKGQLLLDTFDNIAAIFNATPTTLRSVGLKQQELEGLINPNWDVIETDLKWLQESNHHLVTLQNEFYPPLLKQIPDPPLALFVNGDPQILSTSQLGIVGSRNPSHAGMDNAYDFAKFLAQFGLTITSGFALGIDTESHKGALAAKGKTIAVMGTSLDKIYPASNKTLAKQIVAEGGALISEFALNMPAKAENFPRRNRIISGLSSGILVVEATIRSGSLITARLATEQGREVFAIPGSIHNPLARGCHTLIRQGAKLVETAQDVLEELGPLTAAVDYSEKKIVENKVSAKIEPNNLDSDYQKLLQCIEYEATPIDTLVERSGFTASQVSSMLLILELQEYVKSTPGGYIKHHG